MTSGAPLRLLALAAAFPLAATAYCQVDFGSSMAAGLRYLKDRELLPNQGSAPPTQPSGFPTPPVKRTGDLPAPGDLGPQQGAFHFIRGGRFEGKGPLLHWYDGIEFTDRGYHVWADEAFANRGTDIYTLKGNVRVEGADTSVYGDTVQVDFKNRTFIAEIANSTLKPAILKGQVRDNVYVKALRSFGSEREVFGETTSTTTCSYPEPHYEILAEKTDVRPGRRVIFRKAKIRVLGHTLLNIPYLSIPIDQRTYNNLPEFGQGPIEGYYVKNRYEVPLHGRDAFAIRTDYYTKLGAGVGGDYRYATDRLRGNLRLFQILGNKNSLDIANQHRQEFGWANLTLDTSLQRNNYLVAPNSTLLTMRSILNIPQGRSSTNLSFNRTSNETQGFNTLQQTVGLSDRRYFSPRFSTTLDLNWATNESSFTSNPSIHREQLDVRFSGLTDLQKAQARLDYVRSIPIGETTNFFGTSDLTPVITLLSDSRRLIGKQGDHFPFRAEISVGEFGEPKSNLTGGGRITRSNFDLNLNNPPNNPRKRFQITYQTRFKQDIYSDDTAQYVLQAGTQLMYRLGHDTAFNVRYNYLRPYGFSPLQIDRTGKSNVITTDLSVRPFRDLLLGAQTGYDFNILKQGTQTPYQTVGLRAEYRPSQFFNFRTLSSYDTTRHAYSSTRFDLVYIPGATYIGIGAKYDGLRNTWAALNLFVDGFKIGRLKTSLLFNYNGYLKKFESEHFSFIYDLHCAEAVLQILNNNTGFNSGRQISFFIRLKAFPFDTPFGTGQRGQPIGTGTGRDF